MLSQIAGKQAGYRGMAEFYQSLVCKNNKSIGEEIARVEVITVAPNCSFKKIMFSVFIKTR